MLMPRLLVNGLAQNLSILSQWFTLGPLARVVDEASSWVITLSCDVIQDSDACSNALDPLTDNFGQHNWTEQGLERRGPVRDGRTITNMADPLGDIDKDIRGWWVGNGHSMRFDLCTACEEALAKEKIVERAQSCGSKPK
jgi:hypothetical protein